MRWEAGRPIANPRSAQWPVNTKPAKTQGRLLSQATAPSRWKSALVKPSQPSSRHTRDREVKGYLRTEVIWGQRLLAKADFQSETRLPFVTGQRLLSIRGRLLLKVKGYSRSEDSHYSGLQDSHCSRSKVTQGYRTATTQGQRLPKVKGYLRSIYVKCYSRAVDSGYLR